MSGYCLFWTIVWTWLSKLFQLIVCTLTVMVGFAWWNASAMPCQYVWLALDGPVP